MTVLQADMSLNPTIHNPSANMSGGEWPVDPACQITSPQSEGSQPINNEFGPVWRVTILSASRKGPSEDIHDVRSTAKRMIVSHKDSTSSSAISAQQCKITYHISFSHIAKKKKSMIPCQI